MLTALFWDVDGTLVDTEGLHYDCLANLCKEMGCALPFPPSALAGLSSLDIWGLLTLEHYFPSPSVWLHSMHAKYQEQLNETYIREGIVDVLQKMQELGIPQAVVSNGSRRLVDINLKHSKLDHFFVHTLSRDDVLEGKPSGLPYLTAIERLQASPPISFAIEDTTIGISAAKNAGLIAVAFPNAHTKNLDFSLADFVIEHPSELIEIVTGVL